MIRIRFHGRGGHGIKTAGRIAGTAAFLAGCQVQDSPVYGAERRGAPVTAFTRIDRQPVLERGVIDAPDLILIADETLLADKSAAVLSGQESASAIFVNAPSADGLADRYGIATRLETSDLSALTHAALGKASALSAGLGAAAAKFCGLVELSHLESAIDDELSQLHASRDTIDRNLDVARQVFVTLPTIEFVARPAAISGKLHRTSVVSPVAGTASILAAGNATARQTGAWRVERPEIDYDVCTRCGLCVLECPDGAMKLNEQGYPVIDYDHCKGCMICAHLCPLHGIGRTPEVRAW